jgi:Flp pilus assembly protein TadG
MTVLGNKFMSVARMRARAKSGSAIIAPVFFLLLFAIMEIGIIYFAQQTLQHGAEDVARMVRTGQVQAGQLSQSAMKTRLCNSVAPLIPCDGDLRLDVQAFDSFSTVQFTPPLGDDGKMKATSNFKPGNACDVVLVRAFYGWPVFTPLLTPFLKTMSGDKHLLYAAAAFRNEPFDVGKSGC